MTEPLSRSMARRYAVQGDMVLIPSAEYAALAEALGEVVIAATALLHELDCGCGPNPVWKAEMEALRRALKSSRIFRKTTDRRNQHE